MANHRKTVIQQEYHLSVEGLLPQNWSSHMEASKIKIEYSSANKPITHLTICVVDQAALRGILGTLWDLNLKLISINLSESQLKKEGGRNDQ